MGYKHCFCVYFIGIVAIQAAAMGYLANYFFGVGYNQCVIIAVLIFALYSSFGGIRAVALTDVFQFAVIMVAIPIECSFHIVMLVDIMV